MIKCDRILTARQAKALDVKAAEKFGISTLLLMENAGRAVADEVVKVGKKPVAVFCGKGNNGGDGFCAVRHLLAKGIKPDVYLVGSIADVKNEARINLDILLKLKQRVIELDSRKIQLIKDEITKYGLIVDALLGVGLKGEVSGIYSDVIALINSPQAHILSVDIPSGLDATTGRVLGGCVKANTTVTFVAKKSGMQRASGPRYCGKVKVADLGVPL